MICRKLSATQSQKSSYLKANTTAHGQYCLRVDVIDPSDGEEILNNKESSVKKLQA